MAGPVLSSATAPRLRRPRSKASANQAAFWTWMGMPGLVFLAVVFIGPIVGLLSESVTTPTIGLQNFATVGRVSGYAQVAGQTMWLSVLATAISLAIGYPIAYLITNARTAWVRQGLLAVIVASQLTSVMSRTFSWQVILGAQGPIAQVTAGLFGEGTGSLLFTKVATIVGLVHFLLPFMVLPLVTVMERVSRPVLNGATSLGAGPMSRLFRVFVPMTVAGIGIGTILVFVYGVGAYATPAVLGGREGMMLGVVIYSTLQELADNGLAAALSIILLVGVGLAVLLYRATMAGRLEWLLNPEKAPTAMPVETRIGSIRGHLMRHTSTVGQGIVRAIDNSGLSQWRWPHAVFVALVTAFLLGPQVISTVVSFTGERSLVFPPRSYSMQWYQNFFTEPWIRPTLISLLVAVVSSALATILAGMAATCVARSRSAAVKALLTIAMLLPLIVPSVVSAAAFYIAFLPLGLTDSVAGLILAHTCLLLPFSFAILLANVQSISIHPERAAASLGASPLRVVAVVLLPQILSGVVLSFLLGILVSFDEGVVGIFLSGINVQTLPAQMYAAISKEADPTVGVVGTIMMLFVAGAYLAGRALRASARKARMGRDRNE